VTPEKDPKFEALLEYLRRARGFDFSSYKHASLMRRIEKRMQFVKIADFESYLDYLEVHPDEFGHLFDTILINVTSFFRDKPAWDHLAETVLPRLLDAKPANEPIRVWSAGCASGEEAYSLAMLLAEALGEEAFLARVKIYASDADEHALSQARAAGYAPAQLEAVPEPLRARYFTANGDRCVFRADMRRAIIFGRHDLVQDAPISRLDLLVCRNTLMYLNAETQAKILARFHFALNDSGYLFLGKAEMLLTHTSLFVPVELRSRIFAKAPRANARDRLLLMAQGGETEAVNQLARHVRLREEAFNASPLAQMVVDQFGTVVLLNTRMRSLFHMDSRDVGRPLQDLEISYRPLELRSLMDQARLERRALTSPNVERRLASGELQYFAVTVAPLLFNGDSPLGTAVIFSDVTRYHQLQSELQRSNQELETANEELQSAHEELETTNEELQSTNEELETTNEELQSTNEELETMNEELQSTNEELETINAELRERTTALHSANLFLHAILGSLRTAVVVVDRQLKVLIWNYRAEDLWGLRDDEVNGKALLNLDIGLPVRRLEGPIQGLLHGESKDEEVELDAVNRRGRALRCRVSCTPLGSDKDGGVPGVVLLMSNQDQPNAAPGSGDGQGGGS
jgi:two-component system CheB/CheR fusion protein